MADKRISQLIERTDIANNDVLPIVASGATTTNKVTVSTLQDWMQDNLDVGVTSVGITLGTTGTDVNVSGSPITTSGNITINIPDASATARGVVTTGTQTFAGYKIFNGTIGANVDIQLATQGTALNTFIKNINATGQTSIGSNGFGFNNANNIYFSGSSKGGGIIAFSNTGNQTYTLQDASGTLAFTSDLTGYVTLGTAQTITAQKTFTTSGSSDTMIISHGSGSGIALDVIKAGNGEAIRVTKTSGSGNAVTITGGTLSAEAGQFSGDLQSATRVIAAASSQSIILTPNLGGTTNRIETTGTLPLALVSAAAITLAAGGTTPQITLATTGAVTLTGNLNITKTNSLATFILKNTSSTTGLWMYLNGLDGYISNQDNGSLILQTNGTDRLTLASTGAATFSSSVTANRYLINGSNGNSGQIIQQGDLFSTAATNLLLQSSSGNGIGFLTNGGTTFNMFINSSGNVGIGTASPSALLHLRNGNTEDVSGSIIRMDLSGINPYWEIQARNGSNGANRKLGFFTSASSGDVMTLTQSGNVGIGTDSPGSILEVIKPINTSDTIPTSGVGDSTLFSTFLQGSVQKYGLVFGVTYTSGTSWIQSRYRDITGQLPLSLQPLGGNVGIGTASPGNLLSVEKSSNSGSGSTFPRLSIKNTLATQGDGSSTFNFADILVSSGNESVNMFLATTFAAGSWAPAGIINVATNHDLQFKTNNLERMRITSGGAVTIGDSSTSNTGKLNYESPGVGSFNGVLQLFHSTSNVDGSGFINFYRNSSVIGSISQSGTTAVVYNTTSDYRLKEDLQEVKGLEKVQAIKVYDYKWITDDYRMDGVLAHELAEVLPYAVTGEKDELYEDGTEKMQGVDYSKIVPILIKAIQEQQEQIDSLKNQIK
jgi:hypothetical protein